MGVLFESIKKDTATWFIGVVISILTIFSSHLSEQIKFHLNKADLRVKLFEEISAETSSFVYSSEIMVEFLKNNWTTKESLTFIAEDYNSSVANLRKKEFVYHSWIKKYWSKDKLEEFENLMVNVKEFDSLLHHFNGEFEKVVKKDSDKERANLEDYKKYFPRMDELIVLLRNDTKKLLDGTE